MTYTPRFESFTGDDCTGTNGAKNRILTLSNDDPVNEMMLLIVDGSVLMYNIDFTLDEGSSSITFLNNVWDDQAITVDYLTDDSTSTTSYLAKSLTLSGTDLTGSNGATSRTYSIRTSFTLGSSITIVLDGATLQRGTDFTWNSTTKTVTFVTAVNNDQDIIISYWYVGSDSYYCTTLQIARYSGIGVEIFNEELGTGDSSTKSFDADNGNIIAGSFVLQYGSSNTLSILEEDVDYIISLDEGLIQLTNSGVTKLSTDNLYLSYTYSPKQSDTLLQTYLAKATSETDKLTRNYWGVAKTSIEYFDGYASGYPQTDEPFGTQQAELPEFELKYKGINSITSVEFLDSTGDVSSDIDEDYIRLNGDDGENGRVIITAGSIPNGKQNVKLTYIHGYDDVPELTQELCALISGMMVFVNISGGSYKDISTYSLGRKSFSIGQVYVNVREAIDQMKTRVKELTESLGPRLLCV